MFGIGWPEIFILTMAALVILGPERLPSAMKWAADSMRSVREYASGATEQLRQEFGPELDEFRQPLAHLNELRTMTPQAVVTKFLLDEGASPAKTRAVGATEGPTGDASAAPAVLDLDPATNCGTADFLHSADESQCAPVESAPFDADAT